jgi:hypothetical protein
MCRDSSVVEHFHGKEGVPGSSPGHGSIYNLDIYHSSFVKISTSKPKLILFN